MRRTSRDHDSPSFSSTLLDQIYRSIDEGETKSNETNFYRQQQTTSFNKLTNTKHHNIPRTEQKLLATKDNRKSRRHRLHDKDVLFFSSTSISSDSSSSVFSSSDTDSLSRASCFASQWPNPKPVRTSASFRFEKEKQATRVFDDAKQSAEIRGEEALLIKNKSRALKIYNNLKKVKQPISPGGKLTSFLNSLLFTTGNNVKKKSKGACEDVNSSNVTCSSTRSCLSKTTSSSSSYGVNKTVRFVPVEEKESSRVVIKEAARKFLNEYRNNHKKNDLSMNHYDDGDDDVASCASSDLFELDHLDVLGDSRYCEDLPVYETTRISTNRAIANGLIV